MPEYEPEIGQACFGQSHQRYKASELLKAVLFRIKDRLNIVLYNRFGEWQDSPFENTGAIFECPTFCAHAYSWDEKQEQEWNFKWGEVRVSWYKHLGRGTSVNREMSLEEIEGLLVDCLAALDRYDEETERLDNEEQ